MFWMLSVVFCALRYMQNSVILKEEVNIPGGGVGTENITARVPKGVEHNIPDY